MEELGSMMAGEPPAARAADETTGALGVIGATEDASTDAT
jgi:hypothetical protein